MALRVLFVTTTYPLTPGDSIPSFVADLAQALVRDQEIEVRVIAPHHAGAAKRETVNGVEIQRFQYALDPDEQCVAYGGGIPDNLRNFPRAKWQLPGFFAAMSAAVWRNAEWADVIHAHWVEPAFLAMMANHASRPLVVSVHSLKPKANRLHRFTLSHHDCVLFNSQYTMSQAHEKGYFPCRGQVVYQGYDERLSDHSREGTKRVLLWGIPADATVIMALGRMIEVKGLHVLARAADRILRQRPHAHLIFAGDGPMRSDIENLAMSCASRARIHFTGALPRHQVAQLLAEADIFVNPGIVDSRGRAEGLGITTIEAMASALPCVASRVGGISETVIEGVTGFLVPAGDEGQLASAVGRLADDAELRKQMGAAAKESAKQRFTWRILAGQVSDVYRQLSHLPTP